jgi:hypothetical protein
MHIRVHESNFSRVDWEGREVRLGQDVKALRATVTTRLYLQVKVVELVKEEIVY